jgi:hypothetical protein
MGGNPSLDAVVNQAIQNPGALQPQQLQMLLAVHLAYFYPVDLPSWAANENALWACLVANLGLANPNPPTPPSWFNQGLSLAEVLA